jgi:hypothetical protein
MKETKRLKEKALVEASSFDCLLRECLTNSKLVSHFDKQYNTNISSIAIGLEPTAINKLLDSNEDLSKFAKHIKDTIYIPTAQILNPETVNYHQT